MDQGFGWTGPSNVQDDATEPGRATPAAFYPRRLILKHGKVTIVVGVPVETTANSAGSSLSSFDLVSRMICEPLTFSLISCEIRRGSGLI